MFVRDRYGNVAASNSYIRAAIRPAPLASRAGSATGYELDQHVCLPYVGDDRGCA